eukprot:962011-Pyramimonas_sp.AAC.1
MSAGRRAHQARAPKAPRRRRGPSPRSSPRSPPSRHGTTHVPSAPPACAACVSGTPCSRRKLVMAPVTPCPVPAGTAPCRPPRGCKCSAGELDPPRAPRAFAPGHGCSGQRARPPHWTPART